MEGKLTGAEQAEYASLQRAVAQIEGAMVFAGPSDFGTAALMSTFLANAKTRLATIERGARERAEREREAEDRQNGIVAALVERERALNAAEKAEYGELLQRDHFTRADFGRLEHFYSRSWNRLTEGGKDELSHRVWEGVRRHEYRFDELPEVVKEKEAQRVELILSRSQTLPAELEAIPEQDRRDFMQARTNGERQTAYAVLDRPSFAQDVAVAVPRTVASVEKGGMEVAKAQTAEAETAKMPPSTQAVDAAPSKGSIKLSSQKMQLIEVADSHVPAPLGGIAVNPGLQEKGPSPRY